MTPIDRIIADARRECLADCGSNDDTTVMRWLAAKLALIGYGTSAGYLRAGLDPSKIGKSGRGEPEAL